MQQMGYFSLMDRFSTVSRLSRLMQRQAVEEVANWAL